MSNNKNQNQAPTPTDEELDAIEAAKAEQTEEIAQAVAEAVAETKAEMEASIADQVAAAVKEALKGVNTSGGTSTPAAPVGTGIFDPNPVKAKIAREKSKKKQVIALERGYYDVMLREEGDIFSVPVDEKADWFEDYKGAKGGNADEELV